MPGFARAARAQEATRSRFASRQRRLNLAAITPTRVTETQCIAVSHPSQLYVTDDYVVTHKTAFAMNIIEHVAADNRLPCAVFSLEMSKQQLAQRMLCSRGQIDAHKLRKGMLQTPRIPASGERRRRAGQGADLGRRLARASRRSNCGPRPGGSSCSTTSSAS